MKSIITVHITSLFVCLFSPAHSLSFYIFVFFLSHPSRLFASSALTDQCWVAFCQISDFCWCSEKRRTFVPWFQQPFSMEWSLNGAFPFSRVSWQPYVCLWCVVVRQAPRGFLPRRACCNRQRMHIWNVVFVIQWSMSKRNFFGCYSSLCIGNEMSWKALNASEFVHNKSKQRLSSVPPVSQILSGEKTVISSVSSLELQKS